MNNKKRWSKEDKQYLTDNYNRLPMRDLVNHLKRPVNAIRWAASALGLTSKMRYWTKEDIEYLAANYKRLGITQVAQHLNRAEKAVKHKAGILNLTKRYKRIDNTDIDTDVPYYSGKAGEYMFKLQAMKIGDSFLYPQSEKQTLSNCIIKLPENLFKTKTVDNNTRRVWRLL